MKLVKIKKRLHRQPENQAFAEQIEQKIELSNTVNNDDNIDKTNQELIKTNTSRIEYLTEIESIAFWQMYFLKWAIKSESYSFMKYIFFKVGYYPKLPHSTQRNRTIKLLGFALNKRNWKRINNLRSKYQAFVQRSHEPESAWISLIVALFVYLYLIYPEDLIPEWFPLLGLLDDFLSIIFVIIILAVYLQNNITNLNKSEVRKYIFILELIFSFGIAGVVSVISSKFLLPVWAFFYTQFLS